MVCISSFVPAFTQQTERRVDLGESDLIPHRLDLAGDFGDVSNVRFNRNAPERSTTFDESPLGKRRLVIGPLLSAAYVDDRTTR
jgi:hypothetical protein